METVTADQEQRPSEDTEQDISAAEIAETRAGAEETERPDEDTRSPARLFKFSSWVHIGPDAENCEEAESGSCANRLHFHAWCRLPNPLQHSEIREKAQAAKARRIRQLRDEESDAFAILEAEMEEIARQGDTAKPSVIDELLNRDYWRDFTTAVGELSEAENDHDEKIYEHIEDDQRRYQELNAKGEGERNEEEFRELERHIGNYADELRKKVDEIQKPQREALEAQDINALVDQVREQRIVAASGQAFVDAYREWEWYYGTLKAQAGSVSAGERRFRSREELIGSDAAVIEALRETFADLEQAASAGNS